MTQLQRPIEFAPMRVSSRCGTNGLSLAPPNRGCGDRSAGLIEGASRVAQPLRCPNQRSKAPIPTNALCRALFLLSLLSCLAAVSSGRSAGQCCQRGGRRSRWRRSWRQRHRHARHQRSHPPGMLVHSAASELNAMSAPCGHSQPPSPLLPPQRHDTPPAPLECHFFHFVHFLNFWFFFSFFRPHFVNFVSCSFF